MDNNIKLRIKKIRNNTTQQQFAKAFGVTRQTISQIERGINTPSNQLIKLISKEHGVREEWLKYGKGEMKKSPENIIMEAVKYLSDKEIKAALNKLNDKLNTGKSKEEKDKATLYKILDFLKKEYDKGSQDMKGYLTIKLKKSFPEYEEYTENTKKEE